MLILPCLSCYTAVRVMGEDAEIASLVGEDSEFSADDYKCINCGKVCALVEERQVEAGVLNRMKVRELTPQEMYAALHGLGTPDEMVCDAATVREVFATKKVKRVHGEDVRGTSRFSMEMIEFEDGTRMFFGASPSGAIVFRIARPFSYAQEVLNGS